MEDASNTEKQGGLPGYLVPVIAAAIAAVIVVVIVFTGRTKYEPVAAGRTAPEFTLPDLNGNMVSLKALRGKVVFLNFWATWCKPCEEEMPSMQALYDMLKERQFEILAVSVDTEGPEAVDRFVKKYGITFPVLHDRRGNVKDLYKTTGVPETFVIDQNGVIAEKVWGPRDWTQPRSIETVMELITTGPKPKEAYTVKK
jgi:peroxiredoxin